MLNAVIDWDIKTTLNFMGEILGQGNNWEFKHLVLLLNGVLVFLKVSHLLFGI